MKKSNEGSKLLHNLMQGRNCKYVNTSRPRQKGSDFLNDIFKCIFFNANVWISIKVSLNLFLNSQLTISQHWLRQWLGTVQATSHYLNQCRLVYWCINASVPFSELNAHTKQPFCYWDWNITRKFVWRHGYWKSGSQESNAGTDCVK